MVAPNIRTVVVEVALTRDGRGRLVRVGKDLLPWADPYIAKLVAKLKAEILAERAAGQQEEGLLSGAARQAEHHALRGEAPPPFRSSEMQERFRDDFRRGPREE